MNKTVIKNIKQLGFPWETSNPFLFCVYHADAYPRGNKNMGPDTSLSGRNFGQDFTLNDGWRMYHGKKVPGFPAHPHRGFETITVVEKGIVDHADSMGASGRYGDGDVQWMTAGKGIQHSEMFPLLNQDKENPLELFQIWLNLPAGRKFVRPYYTMHWNENIPSVILTDENNKKTTLKIVAGTYNNISALPPAPDSWASDSNNEVAIFMIRMDAEVTFKLPAASKSTNRSIFFFEGSTIKIGSQDINLNHVINLAGDKEIIINNGRSSSRLLFMQGNPIKENVVQHGPFVMNAEEEIHQAYADFRSTRFGGWPWPANEMVHDRTEERFARYADGKEEIP